MRLKRIAVVTALLISGSALATAQGPPATTNVAPATIVTVPSASLGREQVATILLPEGYRTSGQRYPVLYLLHGGGQDHTAFAARGWFRGLASRGMIIVTPAVGDSWYVNSVADATAKYEDFVVKDLIPFVDAQYRTIGSREGRALAGVSMGAWGAMMLGLKHQQLFGAIGALSAPFDISRQDPKIDMTSRTQRFVERLTALKISYEYRELSPFGHSWDVWDGQLVNFVDLMATRWRHSPR